MQQVRLDGSHSVTLQPSGKSFDVEDGQDILSAALGAGIGISYSCRRGLCRACRGKIIEGEVAMKASSQSAEDIAAGYRLLCQSRPLTDVVVETRLQPVVLKSDTVRALISDVRLAAPDVLILTLRLQYRLAIKYQAGQYVDLLLEDGKRRSYSLASQPEPDGNWALELHVRHSPGGFFTDPIFAQSPERRVLTVNGPLGTFFIREDSQKPIVMVASGTGYAPIRAMILHALQSIPNRQIHFYWGARKRRDLYLLDEPTAWAAEHSRLTFIPVLSQADDDWDGRQGFVHEAVMADFHDMADVQVYACGAPAMVDAARRDFTSLRALPESEFYADSFLTEADSARLVTTV